MKKNFLVQNLSEKKFWDAKFEKYKNTQPRQHSFYQMENEKKKEKDDAYVIQTINQAVQTEETFDSFKKNIIATFSDEYPDKYCDLVPIHYAHWEVVDRRMRLREAIHQELIRRKRITKKTIKDLITRHSLTTHYHHHYHYLQFNQTSFCKAL